MISVGLLLISICYANVSAQDVVPLQGPSSKTCSPKNDFCVTMVDSNASVMLTLEGPENVQKPGYLAVGFGKSMTNSDVYWCWPATSGTTPACRNGSIGNSKSPPQVDATQGIRVVNTSGSGQYNSNTKRWTVSFIRDKVSANQSDTAIDLRKPIPMIWAMHPSSSPSGDIPPKHSAEGTFEFEFSGNDTSSDSASQPGPSSGSSVTSTPAGNSNGHSLNENGFGMIAFQVLMLILATTTIMLI